jgi:hypothetical protein
LTPNKRVHLAAWFIFRNKNEFIEKKSSFRKKELDGMKRVNPEPRRTFRRKEFSRSKDFVQNTDEYSEEKSSTKESS